jgi:acyl carrier protein
MGLDVVELILEIEDRFHTRLGDAEAEKISTVGQLYQWLMNRIERHNSGHCATLVMFNSIRQILQDYCGVDRPAIHPTTQLQDLVPAPDRFLFWRTIEAKLDLDLPRLRRSKLLQRHGDLFPVNLATVGDLARECNHCSAISSEFRPQDAELVWWELCKIVEEVSYVKANTLNKNTSFQELGF